jgi:crotonobetainyl-CoA:carnitine CoA-transferase CaiB-like acyl-CoA transferase
MSGEENVRGMLSSYRILDLTNERGFICGKVLADLGADVIKIEKPGGDPARSMGPFYHDIPDPEKSLYWFAFNTNKRGITLDIETADGQEIFKRLIKNADIVIESFDPGYMDKLGLGYSTLSQVNPRMIMTSITYHGPFLKTSETFDRVYRRAPLIGEHNEEVYIRELGMSKEELLTLKQMEVI